MVSIRKETVGDIAAIRKVNLEAFGGTTEATLVDMLRDAGALSCSLVAVLNNEVVGHLALSPVSIVGTGQVTHGMGLAPMAVLPQLQKRGIGTQLLHYWLQTVARQEDNLVAVLGHAEYYPKFGFVPAKPLGISCEYDVPDENFMVLELKPGVLQQTKGVVKYHEVFGKLE